ncbi:phosphatidate cytidylyltransferase [Methyloceanibacter sp.]|uniref:phosphatidate cytidylyltransferase n=1 Tax=Methyloceanibacter sp. TaxID=1965321 RepID=UPI003569E681
MTPTQTPSDKHPKDPAPQPMPELLRRIISALVLGAIALAAVIASPWSFLVLVIVAGGLLAWEWGSLTRGSGFDGTALVHAIAAIAIAVLVAFSRPDLAILILGLASVALFFAAPDRRSGAWALAGLLYVALPVWSLIWLRSDPNYGLVAILFLLAIAWTTDTASYFGGRSIGGPKLAPRISPKKTWAGFFTGVLTAAAVGYAIALYLGGTSPWILALVGAGLALACQLGDLLESAVKRHFGVKDMSQLIPGHGGLFDRIDSLLLAAVVAGLIALRNPAAPGAGLLIW